MCVCGGGTVGVRVWAHVGSGSHLMLLVLYPVINVKRVNIQRQKGFKGEQGRVGGMKRISAGGFFFFFQGEAKKSEPRSLVNE